MKVNMFTCLFAFILVCSVTAEVLHRVLERRKPVTVRCPQSVEGDVTWSRERNGHKVYLLTTDGYGDIRHNDPRRRFSSLVDKSLYICRVTDSDTGRYFCNDEAAVDLTVIPSGTHRCVPERDTVELTCPHHVGGSGPSWSRDFGEIDERRVSRVNEMLTIRDVRPADAGLYYCDGRAAAYLTVTEGEGSGYSATTMTTMATPTTMTTMATMATMATPTTMTTMATMATTATPETMTTMTTTATPETMTTMATATTTQTKPAVSYLWQTVRTVIGVLYLIIMTSITVTVTVWTKAGEKQSGRTVETEYVL